MSHRKRVIIVGTGFAGLTVQGFWQKMRAAT
jgi:hypothetical protein